MRFTKYCLGLSLCVVGVLSCKKDNYDAPNSTLSGRLVYGGDSIGLEKDQVPFELYQNGFGKVGALGATFTPEGRYSALLFDGEYKMIIPANQGPFLSKVTGSGVPDSLSITLKGDQTLDIEVTPFYMIRNTQIAASGGNAVATFGLEKIVVDANAKDVESVALYINKGQFVSPANNIALTEMSVDSTTDMSNITMSVAIPGITPTQNYVFARVGLKINGVEDRMFSPLVKLTF